MAIDPVWQGLLGAMGIVTIGMNPAALPILALTGAFGAGLAASANSIKTGSQPSQTFNAGPGASVNFAPNVLNKLSANNAFVAIDVASPTTYTIAAANNMRIQLLSDVGSYVRSLQANFDTSVPAILGWLLDLEFWSTNDFVVQPFVVVQRNGQTISSVDYSGNDLATAVESSLGSEEHYTVYGPLRRATKSMDGGTTRFSTKAKWDLAWLCRVYQTHYQKKEFDNTNACELKLGICVIGQANTAVVVDSTRQYAYLPIKSMSIV